MSRRDPGGEYPTFSPDDDDFHDGVMTDRWWETETSWFSWNVPERKIGGWTYCQARPNAAPVQRRRLGMGRLGRVSTGSSRTT